MAIGFLRTNFRKFATWGRMAYTAFIALNVYTAEIDSLAKAEYTMLACIPHKVNPKLDYLLQIVPYRMLFI